MAPRSAAHRQVVRRDHAAQHAGLPRGAGVPHRPARRLAAAPRHRRRREVQDADMVSGMLTAIRDFVGDSFKVSEDEGLEALKVGELSVWIEQGPQAVLAAVMRGSAPRASGPRSRGARTSTCSSPTSSKRSRRYGALRRRPHDTRNLSPQQYRPPAARASALDRGGADGADSARVWAGVFTWRARSRRHGISRRCAAEPGIVVLFDRRGGGRWRHRAARSAGARSGGAAGRAEPAPEGVNARWQLYQALDPSWRWCGPARCSRRPTA